MVGEVDEQGFDWLKDEADMKITAVYIDEVDEVCPEEEERKVYEYRTEV